MEFVAENRISSAITWITLYSYTYNENRKVRWEWCDLTYYEKLKLSPRIGNSNFCRFVHHFQEIEIYHTATKEILQSHNFIKFKGGNGRKKERDGN